MSWQPEATASSTLPDAEAQATAAVTFLIGAVHGEVDSAEIGPITVLARETAGSPAALYAVAVAQGPLRAYLVTAWGPVGRVHGKRIVSYPTPGAAHDAFAVLLAERTTPMGNQGSYHVVGVYTL